MVSIREYAENKGCSYEAIRQQVNRYRTELEEHITKVGRTQYLDDAAVEFLDQKRTTSPSIVLTVEKAEEIERLKQENKNLLLQIASLQDELLKEKDQVKLLQNEKIELLEGKKKSWWNKLRGR